MDADVRRWAVDAGERIGATAAAAGVSEALVVVADLPQWASVPLIVGLTAVKAWLARWVGDRGSAAVRRGDGG